ncbi:MAG: sigma-70 family RNA polymerase sigma factor [Firmicutes bacterium HGW-Firmicutes-7]|nr:MAG: sigma-70 family RNA polymerase sigma factor [Firmicutes bacterium HGW-Firmicutes-7]
MLIFLNVIDHEIIRNHLEKIYHYYSKDLWYIANDILNDPYEAEDVVQVALIKISDYLDEQSDVRCNKTKGLIVIIVRNLSINIYNQRKRRATINIDELDEVIQDETNVSPELNVLRLDQSRQIAKHLSKINKRYADILTLKYTYEYTDQEIAGILCISEGNVRTRLARAKKALEKVLGGEYYEWA